MNEASAERAAAILMCALLVVMFFTSSLQSDPYAAYTSVLGMFLTLLPISLRKMGKTRLPWAVTAGTGAVTLMHVLGIHYGWYDLVWWWDAMTHTMATLIIALVLATALVSIDLQGPDIPMPRHAIPLIVIAGTVLLGTAWEVAEFFFDGAIGMNMQYSLDDTATDLSMDIIGGALVALMFPLILPTMEEDSRGRFDFGGLLR